MKKKIYIVDDEKNIRNLLIKFLESNGYEAKAFERAEDVLEAFKSEKADLVILDIMMPGMNGLECCEKLRMISTVPIILLTAKDSELDYVHGITVGSDDYLIKPFSPTMLLMRIKALLRRVEMNKTSTGEVENMRYLDLEYRADNNMVFCGNKKLDLTQMEYQLLIYMLANPDKVYNRKEMLDNVWGYEVDVETRVTDETIRRIRRKLIMANSRVRIETVWGFGYRLTEIKDK